VRCRDVVTLIALMTMAACGGTSPSPSPSAMTDPLAGLWLGTFTDGVAGTGTLRMTLTSPIAGGVSGTWESTFSNAAANNGGQVSGGASSNGTALFFTSRAPWSCPDGRSDSSFAATLTLNANRLTGNWTALICHGGSVDVAKQN
jgi:hypothetical protein